MPPKKSSSSGASRKKGEDPFRLEQKRLLEEQEALLRQQERARKLIADAPKKLEQLKKRQREPIKINLQTSRAGQTKFGGLNDKFQAAGPAPRRPRPRKAERNLAKLQFVVCLVILAIIAYMVLRAIPPT